MTQNIDTLDLKAGVSEQVSIAAHGDLRSAECSKCRREHPIKTFFEHADAGTLFECTKLACHGIVKPKVVFYGE